MSNADKDDPFDHTSSGSFIHTEDPNVVGGDTFQSVDVNADITQESDSFKEQKSKKVKIILVIIVSLVLLATLVLAAEFINSGSGGNNADVNSNISLQTQNSGIETESGTSQISINNPPNDNNVVVSQGSGSSQSGQVSISDGNLDINLQDNDGDGNNDLRVNLDGVNINLGDSGAELGNQNNVNSVPQQPQDLGAAQVLVNDSGLSINNQSNSALVGGGGNLLNSSGLSGSVPSNAVFEGANSNFVTRNEFEDGMLIISGEIADIATDIAGLKLLEVRIKDIENSHKKRKKTVKSGKSSSSHKPTGKGKRKKVVVKKQSGAKFRPDFWIGENTTVATKGEIIAKSSKSGSGDSISSKKSGTPSYTIRTTVVKKSDSASANNAMTKHGKSSTKDLSKANDVSIQIDGNPNSNAGYKLVAIMQNRAWIKLEDGTMISIRDGDVLPNGSKVNKIDGNENKIVTSSGEISNL